MPSLVSGKQFEHGRGQQVRGRMAIHFERLGILGGQDLQLGVGLERPGQIPQIAVDARDDGVVRQARADGAGDIDRSGPWLDRLRTAVGQPNLMLLIAGTFSVA